MYVYYIIGIVVCSLSLNLLKQKLDFYEVRNPIRFLIGSAFAGLTVFLMVLLIALSVGAREYVDEHLSLSSFFFLLCYVLAYGWNCMTED